MIVNRNFELASTKDNTITFRHEKEEMKIYVLEEELFRVFQQAGNHDIFDRTWAIAPGLVDVPTEGRNRFDLSPFSLPSYEIVEREDTVEIYTSKLKVVVQLEDFKLTWLAKEDNEWIKIANDRKTQGYNFDGSLGEGVYHYLERYRGDAYYGLGEKGGNLNKKGKRFRMLNVDAMGYDAEHSDPLYKHIPYYITYNEDTNMAYGLYYDNYSDSVFDMGAELDNYHGHYRYYQAKYGHLDYYFILGPKVQNVVERYTWLTGKMVMPPKWSLGYSGSTMTYTDLPDAQEQLKKFIESCKENDIPCDSFQLSSGYTSINDKRYVFNWNTSKIPTPKEMTKNFHDNSINLCANIKPCLLQDHPLYNELEEEGYFIRSAAGDKPELAQFWDDVGSYLDFTNPKAYDWWKNKVKEQLLEYGIDSTWNDNNEFEIWDDNALADGFGNQVPISYIKPIQTMLMIKSSYEAQTEFAPEKRPYLISRAGSAGIQRYIQTWSGDNFTEWKTIRYNLKMGLGLSLSGVSNFGHDVGGFSGNAPDPELLIRWIQNGIFHPRFTIHSWNDDKTVNTPWMYPEYIDVIRELMKERVKWIPYMYHLVYKAHHSYEPILTPTFYHFDQDGKTFEENDDFLVGKDLLICNVMDKGAKTRNVYLPENGEGWYDINNESYYEGGKEFTVDAPLNVIPMFAQAGAVLPITDGTINFDNKNVEKRGLLVYPTAGNTYSERNIYEDDGESLDYQKGVHTYICTTMNTTKEKVEFTINLDGEYEVPYDQITIHFPSTEKRNVYVNGEEVNVVQPFVWKL